ncbi:MAG: toll/interleukin-1 receptor domain-containing protein [Lysobacteraceae bacterium]|nr:MAG: toll/interleukin-1 receptor domain-containing protein [Xanthomonadaceae bacterium]
MQGIRRRTTGSGMRYHAFISYSHADARWAAWLHRNLESYRLPSRLRGGQGDHGPLPERLSPIFRDREDLSSSGHLGPQIQQALVASEALVVVCSPGAVRSPWVESEIREFKRLGRGDRIYGFIVEGEPNADDARECFPRALRFDPDASGEFTEAANPVAADARPGKDGKSLARLKLLAGLFGLPLDTLRQREAQRRHRRMAAITALAVLVMLATSILAVQAVIARNAAERRQKQAEALVDFMLGDDRHRPHRAGRPRQGDGKLPGRRPAFGAAGTGRTPQRGTATGACRRAGLHRHHALVPGRPGRRATRLRRRAGGTATGGRHRPRPPAPALPALDRRQQCRPCAGGARSHRPGRGPLSPHAGGRAATGETRSGQCRVAEPARPRPQQPGQDGLAERRPRHLDRRIPRRRGDRIGVGAARPAQQRAARTPAHFAGHPGPDAGACRRTGRRRGADQAIGRRRQTARCDGIPEHRVPGGHRPVFDPTGADATPARRPRRRGRADRGLAGHLARSGRQGRGATRLAA